MALLPNPHLMGATMPDCAASAVAERMRGLDTRFLREWERLDALAYDERRAKLRKFNVGVTLWKRDHEPRFAIDWVFDLSACDLSDQEEEQWVIYTRESSVPHANSSGRSVNRSATAVRLRWTNRDLTSAAAD